jgi:outer membrane protein assembly factor BamB
LPKQGRGQGEAGAQLASPVIVGGYMYQLYRGELWCIEVASGKKVYAEPVETEREGSDKGFPTFASPFATADGLIYFASAAHTFVLKGGPKFEVVAINELGDVGRGNQGPYFFTSAAVSDGKIFILGEKKLWCLGKKEPPKD